MASADQQPLIEKESISNLSTTAVRHGFVQKVYGILGVQLIVTTILGGLVMVYGQGLMKHNPGLAQFMLFGSLFISIAMMFVFICCPDNMRKSPQNYILLSLFTVAESVLVGFSSLQYTQASVLMVFGMTAFIVVALTIFACQTSVDFTGMGPYLFAAMLCLMALGFCISIASYVGVGGSGGLQTMRLVYAAFGALLFSFYIIYDTQLIIGGDHKNAFSIDDYAMAAISLYIDIIQMFLMLLELFGDRR